MKVVMINGSPRGRNGASGKIIAALCDRLSDVQERVVCELAKQSAAEVVDAIRGCDALVFVFPLYVDGLPSGLARFLDEERRAVALAAPRAKIYAVVNNGFYEARQNAVAIDMMEIFCASSGLAWGRGLGIGCGGMLGEPLSFDRFPLKKLGRALDVLANNIRGQEGAENYFVEPSIPRFLYMIAGNFGMKREMKKRAKKVHT